MTLPFLGAGIRFHPLYAACGKNFSALNKDDGRQIWTRAALDSESAPVMLKDGVLVFVSDRQLVAVDRDGKTLWAYPHTSAIGYDPRTADNTPAEFGVDTPIAVGSDETLYVGSRLNERFLALNVHGVPKMGFHVGQGFRTSPVIASDGTVLAVTFEGVLCAFASDGSLKWKFQLPKKTNGDLHAAPVLGSDGTIYLLAEQMLIAMAPQGRLFGICHCRGPSDGPQPWLLTEPYMLVHLKALSMRCRRRVTDSCKAPGQSTNTIRRTQAESQV
jgi:outer membrane protein assembly factor BamB